MTGMMHTPEEIMTKLGELDADEIARLFRDEGVIGMPRMAGACPVSVYASALTDQEVRITWAHWYERNRPCTEEMTPLPEGVLQFIRKFDNGGYLDLIGD